MRALRAEYLRTWEHYRAAPAGRSTEAAWAAARARLVRRYGLASAELAADYYAHARTSAGVPGTFPVPASEPASPRETAAALKATVERGAARPDGDDDDPAVEEWRTVQRDREVACLQRVAAHAGRTTIERAARADPEAVGWVRVTGGDCCAFCALLAVRGLVYADATSAVRTAAGDPYHDRCACSPEPVFRGRRSEPEPQVAAWEALYYEAARGVYGDDKLRAFRRAFEDKYRSAPAPTAT